jgi:hypothetical protein
MKGNLYSGSAILQGRGSQSTAGGQCAMRYPTRLENNKSFQRQINSMCARIMPSFA